MMKLYVFFTILFVTMIVLTTVDSKVIEKYMESAYTCTIQDCYTNCWLNGASGGYCEGSQCICNNMN
ncbi:defensin-like protein 194 [Vespula squamosa]|uniref:Defensin-like protein 194 n=1 Tax=Vespula squamosa TaxID=30214 RepID=A0ABD2APD5_VESSQ